MTPIRRARAVGAFAALVFLSAAPLAAAQVAEGYSPPNATWAPLWTASPAPPRFDGTPEAPLSYENQTVRQDIRLGAAARTLRLRVSNEVGVEPLSIGGMTLTADGRTVRLTFSGQTAIDLPPGQVMFSDPVPADIEVFETVTVQTYLPGSVRGAVRRTPVRIGQGDAAVADDAELVRRQSVISAVLGETERSPVVVVALGDSITEGATSTLGANADWPSVLAQRLHDTCPGGYVVVNAGISGNQVIRHGRSPSVLMRLDRDVLSQPRVDFVILIEGINDIRHSGDPSQPGLDASTVIAGYRQIADRLALHGVRLIGGTVMPFDGSERYDARSADTRRTLNAFIRESDAFAGVADFDAATRDPANPEAMQTAYSRDDHLHPNDAGYEAMANGIDLGLLAHPDAACGAPSA